MAHNYEVTRTGDTVIVRNHNAGAALTFRDGMIVFREGNHTALTKNNIKSMQLVAEKEMLSDTRDAA